MSEQIKAIKNNDELENLFFKSPKERLNKIFDHEEPIKQIKKLSGHDLLLTIKEVGESDSLSLMPYLSAKQVQEMLDLDIWQEDNLDIESLGKHLLLLLSADPDKAIKQISLIDIELLGLSFKLVSKIYDTTLGEEPIEYPERYSISPDKRFIVCFMSEHEKKPLALALHGFLERLYGRDLKLALGILEKIRLELASGLCESSYKFRCNRLMDMGILPFEERLIYFSPLTLKELDQNKSFEHEKKVPKEPSLAIKNFIKVDESLKFFNAALKELDEELKSFYFQQLSYTASNVFASLSGDFSNRERMIEITRYTKNIIEFGLISATKGDISFAKEKLLSVGIRNLFRLGRTSLVLMRRSLTKKLSDTNYLFGKDYIYADSPLREVAKAISLAEPHYYEGLLDPKKQTIRLFESLKEMSATIKAIKELLFRSLVVGPSILGGTEEKYKNIAGMCHAGFFALFMINDYLGKDEKFSKIERSDLEKIFTADFRVQKEFVEHIKTKSNAMTISLGELFACSTKEAKERLAAFIDVVLIGLEKNHEEIIGAAIA